MTVLKILAQVLTAVILVPSGAHFFELPGKIGLDREVYFIVQGIYGGWALFAVPIFLAILANTALFMTLRRHDDPTGSRWALVSTVLIIVSLVIFFIWVFPANQATNNWTVQPECWKTLRSHWEYGHAINGLIVFVAFLATTMATVRR